MKTIKTTLDIEMLKKELLIEEDEESLYALIENGHQGAPDLINVFFDPKNINKARELLMESGYYQNSNSHLLGKREDEYHLIQYPEIIYIEGIQNDTYVHTRNGEFRIKQKLYELELLLHDKKCVRISKSYIVSILAINKIKPTFNGKLVLHLKNGTELEVSRHYITTFKAYLGM